MAGDDSGDIAVILRLLVNWNEEVLCVSLIFLLKLYACFVFLGVDLFPFNV